MTVLSYLLACVCAYLFFCGISIDPKAQATVYVGNPMWGFSRSIEAVRDPTFRLFGIGGLVWAATLILLSRYNVNYCSLRPETLLSLNALLGILTTVVTTKVLFGPIMQVRKSVRLVGEQQYDRPVSFMLYDAIRVWPSNLLEKVAWKLLVVASIAIVIWLYPGCGTCPRMTSSRHPSLTRGSWRAWVEPQRSSSIAVHQDHFSSCCMR